MKTPSNVETVLIQLHCSLIINIIFPDMKGVQGHRIFEIVTPSNFRLCIRLLRLEFYPQVFAFILNRTNSINSYLYIDEECKPRSFYEKYTTFITEMTRRSEDVSYLTRLRRFCPFIEITFPIPRSLGPLHSQYILVFSTIRQDTYTRKRSKQEFSKFFQV